MSRGVTVCRRWLIWSCMLLAGSGMVWAGKKGRCDVCKKFVEAFEESVSSTANSNYAGGDTSWEEEKLGAYANSEVRLVEILDGVCKDYECHRLLENNEEHIERWWFKLRHNGKTDLKMWLCHDHLDVCCPANTYGPTCSACPGGVKDPCGGRGFCEGAEEKDGSGECKCNNGYDGDTCQKCNIGFYNDSLNCLMCHRACSPAGCDGGSASDCVECASGYKRSEEEEECKDVDECSVEGGGEGGEGGGEGGEGGGGGERCAEGKYCLNTPGGFRCNDCDKSCKKACFGAGPARCVECGLGYYEDQYKLCKDIDECSEKGEEGGARCEGDTYCDNTQGSYECRACHVACRGGCRGPGPANCSECRDGFALREETCEDIDECNEEKVPCNPAGETCQNLIGSFSCQCKPGLVRKEGKCVATTTEDRRKKKSKRKKRTKKGNRRDSNEEEEEEEERRVFPWYHVLGPLSLAIVAYKYSKPNLVTSALLTLVLTVVVI